MTFSDGDNFNCVSSLLEWRAKCFKLFMCKMGL